MIRFRVFLGFSIALFIPLGFWFYYFEIKGLPKPLKKWFPTGEVRHFKFRGADKVDSMYHTIADFKLLDQNGQVLTNDSFKDRIYVASFFFCSCKTVCPILNTQLFRIQEEFKNVKWIKILSHTVNPENDSVGVLKAYSKQYKVDDNKWKMVTGKKQELYDLCTKSYFLAVQDDGGIDNFDHSEKFVLVDNHRIIRGYYDGSDSTQVTKMMDDIVILLKELSNDVNELRPPRK
jgi:protein SCO1